MSCFADNNEFASLSTCGECGLMGPLDKVEQHYLDSHCVDGNDSCNEIEYTEDLQLEDPEECETENITSLGEKNLIAGPTNRGHKSDGNNEWCEAETRLLLDKYESYLKHVGPMKKFKRKKDMWQQISKDIKTILNITKTPTQCENRYKTILKRKKKAVDNNNQTGRNRVPVEYEAELAKIAALDDSIEPEVLRDSRNVKTAEKPGNDQKSLKRKREKSVQEVLMDISKQKEEARERRHKEKMKMLEKFWNSKINKWCPWKVC
ncbi:unnamed protein product, partial [Phaedon cochleariae]